MGILICLRAYGNAMSMMRLATGKVMLPAVLSWIQAGVKLSLGFALVRILGLAGLLIASCAATSVQIGGTALYLYREKALEWPTMLKAITLLVLAAIALMLLSGSVMAWTLPTFALGILITGAAWGIVWAAVAVPGETAETLRRFRILPSPAE
jgi:peptidoglycan biosynthesis protein MviN/MurJ (putative lipid II flippase)